jgi:hypothetical protein
MTLCVIRKGAGKIFVSNAVSTAENYWQSAAYFDGH